MNSYRERELLFYDIEVFEADWVIVFKNEQKEVVRIFHCGENPATRPNVFEVTNQIHLGVVLRTIKRSVLVSYNGYHYDDKILSKMITQGCNRKLIKIYNDMIINDESKIYSDLLTEHDVWSIDLSREIEGSQVVKGKTYPPPLKQIESQMGLDIVETSIDFNIDRPLTSEEVDKTIFYCEHDVDALIEIFKIREASYLIPKQVLLERLYTLFPKNYSYGKWLSMNVTTIMGKILMGDAQNKSWESFLTVPIGSGTEEQAKIKTEQFLKQQMEKGFPSQVVDMWKAAYHDPDKGMVKPIDKTTVLINGIKYVFGFGGLHGEPAKHNKRFNSMIMLDVRSLYPNIMINLETLGAATNVFAGIVEERAKVKHVNKVLSDGLKLGINKVYGCLGSRYSKLFNKFGTLSVCVYGQMLLFDLCQRLETIPDLKLLNINTDGVGFNYNGPKEHWQRIWHEWEKDWNLVLEEDYFSEVYQKDVNNYVGVLNGEPHKTVGGMVKQYKKQEYFKNGSLRILHICLVEALVHKIHPRKTVRKNLKDPMLFMQTCYVGRSFDYVVNEREEELPQKVNRIFAVKENYAELHGIWKVKNDGKKTIFPNLPENLVIFNDNLENFDNFIEIADTNYYVQLALSQLKKWGIKEDELN